MPNHQIELLLDLVMGEDLFFAHIHPKLAIQVADAPRLGKCLGVKPPAKGSQAPDPIGQVNRVVVEDNRAHEKERVELWQSRIPQGTSLQ